MRVLIAPDKFKGSLPARAVAENIALGVRDVFPDAEIDFAQIADGGEGTAEAFFELGGGDWVECGAHDALGRPIVARYLWRVKLASAVLEMSEAAGMRGVNAGERDIMRATTFGVGEMMLAARERGAREIVMALGGSATNDGGFGLARALGFRFLAGDNDLTHGPEELLRLTRIVPPDELSLPRVVGAFDVRNPLLGAEGATRVFSKQKGATITQSTLLEQALSQLADIAARDLGTDFRDAAGAGAAGGLGFGLLTFCDATLRPGFDFIAAETGLEACLASANFVITGEGKLDAQTLAGKAPAGVSVLARKHRKRVFAIVGMSDSTADQLFDRVFVLARSVTDQAAAMENAPGLLRERARELARTLAG